MKPAPQNLDAERAVLGAMMLSASVIPDCLAEVRAEDFYRSEHRRCFEAIQRLYAAESPVDTITVAKELPDDAPLWIHELVEGTPSPAAGPHYARMVAELGTLRRIRENVFHIVALTEQQADPSDVLARVEEILAGISTADGADTFSIASVLDEVIALTERAEQGEVFGISTGFRDIDEAIGGLHPGGFYLVAARPMLGKSALTTNIARNVAGQGRDVLLVSLEMSRDEIVQRLIAAEARVPVRSLRSGKGLTSESWGRITGAMENISNLPIHIVDSGSTTVADVRSMARRVKLKGNLGLVIVDYLQLMGSELRRTENRQQEVSDISRSLKVLARSLDVPVIACSQLNRQSESRTDKKPMLADLRESGSLEQDSDVVSFLFEPANEKYVEFIVAKNRHGARKTVKLSFFAEFTKFADYSGRTP